MQRAVALGLQIAPQNLGLGEFAHAKPHAACLAAAWRLGL